MAYARDIICEFINQSIDTVYKTGDERYYLDYYKLRQLMYLAQCYMYAKFKEKLFEESMIVTESSGPDIGENALFIPEVSFRAIKTKCCGLPITHDREDVIFRIIQKYGSMSDNDLVAMNKRAKVYRMAQDRTVNSSYPIIPLSLISQYYV